MVILKLAEFKMIKKKLEWKNVFMIWYMPKIALNIERKRVRYIRKNT